MMATIPPLNHSLRIAIVGDVHDDWDPVKDSQALHALKPDVVLFTGDFGNENVELVRNISKLNFPKAAILGNHDCWQTISPFARYLSGSNNNNGVQQQLDLLGDDHVGFGRRDFPELRLSVVGGRPFSMGGSRIQDPYLKVLAPRYGVHNFHESVQRIVKNTKEAPQENFLILLAHNGPHGLGSNVEDICGRDWTERGADHGDPDLEEAIATAKQQHNIKVPLVVFGHMHEKLQRASPAKRTMLVSRDRTVYLNAAVVPRVRAVGLTALTERHFVVVDVVDDQQEVEGVWEAWVTVGEGEGWGKEDCQVKLSVMYSGAAAAAAAEMEVQSLGRNYTHARTVKSPL